MTPLPFAVREAVVDVCAKAFWYKNRLRSLFVTAGVSAEFWDRHGEWAKPVITRKVFEHLDKRGTDGRTIQYQILKELCSLRSPDEKVLDRDKAIDALRELKELGQQLLIDSDAERLARKGKVDAAADALKARVERSQRLGLLRERFWALMGSSEDDQKRGYDLEGLLEELFLLSDLIYRPSFRNRTEQIDGSFEYKSVYYLVEAKWRRDPPKQGDLAELKTKVDRKLVGTRGVFVSVAGFQDHVIDEFTKGIAANLVLIDGQDLMLILEERISLVEALDIKIARAAQHGRIYYPLSQYL